MVGADDLDLETFCGGPKSSTAICAATTEPGPVKSA